MAKLYAEIENSKGKKVSLSDNEQLTCTVYDGNMKAYSIIINWASLGDPDHWKCPECGYLQEWDNYEDGTPICPECDSDMVHQKQVFGAIISHREWRNRPQTKDR